MVLAQGGVERLPPPLPPPTAWELSIEATMRAPGVCSVQEAGIANDIDKRRVRYAGIGMRCSAANCSA